MMTDLLHKDELHFGGSNDIDGSPPTIEPDRTLTSPVALQRLVVEARNASNLLETVKFYRANPGEQFPRDMLRELAKPSFNFFRKLDPPDHTAAYFCKEYSASRLPAKLVIALHARQPGAGGRG